MSHELPHHTKLWLHPSQEHPPPLLGRAALETPLRNAGFGVGFDNSKCTRVTVWRQLAESQTAVGDGAPGWVPALNCVNTVFAQHIQQHC